MHVHYYYAANKIIRKKFILVVTHSTWIRACGILENAEQINPTPSSGDYIEIVNDFH